MNQNKKDFLVTPKYLFVVLTPSSYKQDLTMGPKNALFPSIIATTFYLNDADTNIDFSNTEFINWFCANLNKKSTYLRKRGPKTEPIKRNIIEIQPNLDLDFTKLPKNFKLNLPLEGLKYLDTTNIKDYKESNNCQHLFNKTDTGKNLTYSTINETNFFSEYFIQNYLLNKDLNMLDHIFIFCNKNWKSLVQQFKNNNTILSGGSGVHRHSFSLIQLELARFILDLESFLFIEKMHTKVLIKTSFKYTKNLQTLHILTSFFKREDAWLIREKVRFLGMLDINDKEILFWKGLYKFNNYNPNILKFLLDIFYINEIEKDDEKVSFSLKFLIRETINKGLDLKEKNPYLILADPSNSSKDLDLDTIIKSLLEKKIITKDKLIFENESTLNKRILELYKNSNIKKGKLLKIAENIFEIN